MTHCPHCGAEVQDTAKFCAYCGRPLAQPQNPTPPAETPIQSPEQPPQRSSPLRPLAVVLAVVLAVLIVALGVVIALILAQRSGGTCSYDECMALAARYLEELDYEQAEAFYLEAIQIDPSQAAAYRELAQLYIDQGREEEALDVLARGSEATGSEELQAIYDELRAGLEPEEADPEPGPEPESNPENADQTEDLALFAGFLQTVHDNPTDYFDPADNPQEEIERCRFAVADIDQDDLLELIIRFDSTYMAAQYTGVWEISDERQVVQKGTLGTVCTFYDNGNVQVDLSHNQGGGETIWPYQLFRYDTASGRYVSFASASCVDEWVDPFDEYSAGQDSDGDGTIYYFAQVGEDPQPLTLEQYEALVDQYIPTEAEIPLIWMELTEENIRRLLGETRVSTGLAAYDIVLEEYFRVLSGECTLEESGINLSSYPYGISLSNPVVSVGLQSIFYDCRDFNQDGVTELILGSEDGYIYDVWTIRSQTAVPVISGYYRAACNVCEGGIVVSYTEGGVYDHDYNYFHFDNLVQGIDEPIDTLTLHPDGTYSRSSETLSASETAELYPLVTDFDWQQFYSVQE